MRHDTTKQQLEIRKSELLRERNVWEDRWKDIRDVILPTHGFFEGDMKNGKRRMATLANDTPAWSVSVMAAGMQSGLTSPNNQWFKLVPEDSALAENQNVREYLTKCEEIQAAYMAKSGMYDVFFNSYEELGAFGIGGFLLLEDQKTAFRPLALTIGEYAIGLDASRIPNEFYRRIELTPTQMVEQFGKDKVSASVLSDFENNSMTMRVVHHLIGANDGRIETSQGLRGMPFLSWYWEDGTAENKFLELSGFEEFPAIISRWTVSGPNIYGYGAGEMALGDASQLQKIELDKLTALEMTLRPPVAMPASMRGRVSLLPAAQNWYDPASGGEQAIKPIFQINPNMQDTAFEIARIEDRIKRAFNVNMFLALMDSNQDTQKTATEVNELHQEKLLMIGPVLQRLDREMLRPCIDRGFAILQRQGRLPEPPEELMDAELKIEYLSPLMMAQRQAGTNAIDRYFQFIGGVLQIDPSVVDNIDLDKTATLYGDQLGVPASLMRNEETVANIRQGRAQAQAQEQEKAEQMELMKQAPQAMKTLSETEPTEGDVLGRLGEAIQQGGV